MEISIDLLRTASNKTKESLHSAEERIFELESEKIELKDEKMVLIDQLKKLQGKQSWFLQNFYGNLKIDPNYRYNYFYRF